MRLFFSFFCMIIVAMVPLMVFAQEGDTGSQEFIYDDHGRRDPFWPLVSSDGVIANYDTDFLITDLSLEGIISGANDENLAIINGQIVQVNDKIGSFTVGNVQEDAVILIKDNKKFMLKLKKGE